MNIEKLSISSIIQVKLRNMNTRSTVKEAMMRRLFYPNSRFIQIWSLLLFFLLIYVFLFTPWIIAFEEVSIGDSFFYIELMVDVLFFCDILVTLNTAFYVNEFLEMDRYKIFKNYLKGFLLLDILAIFPFYLFDHYDSKSNALVRIIRITKFAKIFRASKLTKILKRFECCLLYTSDAADE